MVDRYIERVFMALSDETRRGILVLLEGKERAVGEIVANFHLSQPTISRHLSVLREANLVRDERQGQRVIYRLNGDMLSHSMRDFFGKFQQCREEFREKENAESEEAPAESPGPWARNGAENAGSRPAMVAASAG
ncbi:MAG: winged helix-turn-helix transcriptional regulator [Acidobacteria bacterium]|nr:winged helix-turn-helix transcriptional regulator [Acidobacteriota bacterium]